MSASRAKTLKTLHQECDRSAQQKLLNSVREKNLEDLRVALYHEELECQRAAPQFAAITKNRIRPSAPSTSCSTRCGSRHKRRAGMSSRETLGTSITCSATGHSVSKKRKTSTSCSPISGTRTSRIGSAGAVSTIWSAECCWTRSCGLTPARRSGRDPVAGTSSTSMAKYWVPATWGWDVPELGRVVQLVPTPPLLAVICPRGAAWCSCVARSICSVSCSCRQCIRRRR